MVFQINLIFRVGFVFIIGVAIAASASGANGSRIQRSLLPVPIEPLKNKIFFETVASDDSASAKCSLPEMQEMHAEILRRINALRIGGATCGLEYFPATYPLKWDASLFQAASGHSNDMAQNNVVSHQSMDGRTLADRVLAAGYRHSSVAENITAGPKTVEKAMAAWVASPPHCGQMMSDSFEDIGVACVNKENSFYRNYWTMDLGKLKKE